MSTTPTQEDAQAILDTVSLPTAEPKPLPKKRLKARSAVSQAVEQSLIELAIDPKDAPPSKKRARKAAIAKKIAKSEAKRQKPVRDSFTMPRGDFDLIAELKQRAGDAGRPAKKGELLRAGLHALEAMSGEGLKKTLDALSTIKMGRPKKS